MAEDGVTDSVKQYYGKELQTSDDLKTNACCTGVAIPKRVKEAISRCHPEVRADRVTKDTSMSVVSFFRSSRSTTVYSLSFHLLPCLPCGDHRFPSCNSLHRLPTQARYPYHPHMPGCGLVIPDLLEGCSVLDLGCGAGRDCYIASQFVGEKGSVVGVDMTEEQVSIARLAAFVSEVSPSKSVSPQNSSRSRTSTWRTTARSLATPPPTRSSRCTALPAPFVFFCLAAFSIRCLPFSTSGRGYIEKLDQCDLADNSFDVIM